MAESNATGEDRRPAKRCKVAGSVSYGTAPTEFTGDNKEKMIFHFHNFADLTEKRGERIWTKTIQAGGHKWCLVMYPRGHNLSRTDAEYVSFFLKYLGGNTKTNPVCMRGYLRTKLWNVILPELKWSKEKECRGPPNFKKREVVIRKGLNKRGTLTIEVELEIATEKRSVWFPKHKLSSTTNNYLGIMLYESIEETSDVTFVVGRSKKAIKAHKNILAVQARALYELVITEEESSSSSSKSETTKIVLPDDIDADAFEAMVKYAYGMLPELKEDDNGRDDDSGEVNDNDVDDANEDQIKSILLVADCYGCATLKLHMESCLIRDVLVPSKAARLLLLADSHCCPYLKEACMKAYITDSNTMMQSEEDWKQVKKSSDLLVELLKYALADRLKYSSYVNDGNGTINDADDYDVRSLRERLEAYNLDLDGSREMLLQRWKEYLKKYPCVIPGFDSIIRGPN